MIRVIKTHPRAQSVVEYAAVILVIIAAFIWMGSYYKRSLQGRYRQVGDSISGGLQREKAYNVP